MGLIQLLIVLLLIGVFLYVVERVVPLDESIRLIIRVVVIVAVLLWLLQIFVGDIPIPHLRR